MSLSVSYAEAVPEIFVSEIKSPIKIDGQINEEGWQKASCIPVFVDLIKGTPANISTKVKIGWDTEFLYLAFDCSEPNVSGLVSNYTKKDAALWHDDNIEVFILPPGQREYFLFIFNPKGILYDAKVYDTSYDPNIIVATVCDNESWIVECKIPWSQIGGMPREEMIWKMNFARLRMAGGKNEEFYCWSPSRGSLHNVETFGDVVFGMNSPSINDINILSLPNLNQNLNISGISNDNFPIELSILGGELCEKKVLSEGTKWQITTNYKISNEMQQSYTLVFATDGKIFYRQEFPLQCDQMFEFSRLVPTLDYLDSLVATRQLSNEFEVHAKELLKEGREIVDTANNYAKKETSDSDELFKGLKDKLEDFKSRLSSPILWTHLPFETVKPQMWPEHDSIKEINIKSVINEKESASLLITNLYYNEPLSLRIGSTPLNTPNHIGPSGFGYTSCWTDNIKLSEAVMVRTRKKGVIADAIVPLDGVGRFSVPPQETRELWFTVDTHGMKAGIYSGYINIKSFDPLDIQINIKVPVKLEVLPVELPEKSPYTFGVWDYSQAAYYDVALKNQLESYSNIFYINLGTTVFGACPYEYDSAGKSNLDLFVPLINRVKPHGKIFFDACWAGFVQNKNQWQPYHDKFIRDLVELTKKCGLDYNDWTIHLSDENITNEFLEMAKRAKMVDPNIRISADPMAQQLNEDQVEQLRKFLPYIDLWIPHHTGLSEPGMQVIRQSGKPILPYDCDPGKATSPASNRSLPLKAWAFDLNGVFVWCYMEGFEDIWNDLDGQQYDWANVYPGPTGQIVSSKRWEAWREGIEDVLLISVYENELKKKGINPKEDVLVKRLIEIGKSGIIQQDEMNDLKKEIIENVLKLRQP